MNWAKETDIRPTEAINGLVRVANRTDVSVGRHEQLDETDLLLVHILIFVNTHPLVALTIGITQAGVGLEDLDRAANQIIEIDQVPRIQFLLVAVIDVGRLGPRPAAVPCVFATEMADSRLRVRRAETPSVSRNSC